MSVFDIDYGGVANTSPYTHPDFLYFSNPMRIIGGTATAKDSNATAYALHKASLSATGNIEAQVTVNAASTDFQINYLAVGFYNKDTLKSYVLRVRFNDTVLRSMSQGSSDTPAIGGGAVTRSYTFGDVFKVQLKRDVSPFRLVSFLNGAQIESVVSPIQDFSNYRVGFDVAAAGTKPIPQGVTGFYASGLDIADPIKIESIGASGSINQYQKAVVVKLVGIDTVNMGAVELAGQPVTPTIIDATSFSFDAPGDLPAGSYTLTAAFGAEVYSKTATYVRTHPIKIPDAGVAVAIGSILSQFGNPSNARYLSITKPSELKWRDPHSSFTAENIALDVDAILVAPESASIGASYQAQASIIDGTGVITSFLIDFVVAPEINPKAFKLVILPTYQPVYDRIAES